MLTPNWLSSSDFTLNGTSIINGRMCTLYCLAGFQATGDCMAYDENNEPCRYSETFNFGGPSLVVHNLTFSSWEEVNVPSSVFNKPTSCSKDCKKTYPSCFAPSSSSFSSSSSTFIKSQI